MYLPWGHKKTGVPSQPKPLQLYIIVLGMCSSRETDLITLQRFQQCAVYKWLAVKIREFLEVYEAGRHMVHCVPFQNGFEVPGPNYSKQSVEVGVSGKDMIVNVSCKCQFSNHRACGNVFSAVHALGLY